MKQNLLMIGTLLVTSILSMPSFSIRENPQDPPTEEKGIKHITIKKIDESGTAIKLDTTLGIDEILVWNGDTINGKSVSAWISENGINTDSMLKNMTFKFDIETDTEGENKVIVVKSGADGKHAIHEFITDGDSNNTIKIEMDTDDYFFDHDVMVWNGDEKETFFIPNIGQLPQLPNLSKISIREKMGNNNVIDLSDPGIISYKKKTNKDGTEKITIVRKLPNEKKAKKIEKIILNQGNNDQDLFFGRYPKIQIKEQIKEAEENRESN